MSMHAAVALGAATVLIGAGLAGCGRPVREPAMRRPEGLRAGSAGGSSRVVFPPGPVTDELAWGGAEWDRNDAALGVRGYAPMAALDAWPTPSRPDLNRDRRGYVPTNANTFIYYNNEYSDEGFGSRRPGRRRGGARWRWDYGG